MMAIKAKFSSRLHKYAWHWCSLEPEINTAELWQISWEFRRQMWDLLSGRVRRKCVQANAITINVWKWHLAQRWKNP